MSQRPSAILCLCILLAIASACKKNAPSSIQHNDITGKWRKTRVAIDSNGNGILDNSELLAPSAYDSDHVLVFNGDGTGQITSYSTANVQSFSWSLENNSTYLKIYYPGATTGLTMQHIDALTADAMTLRDTTGLSIEWDLFTKQ